MHIIRRILPCLIATALLSSGPLHAQPDIASMEKPFASFGKSAAGIAPPDTSTRGFDVGHYTLDLRIDPVAESLSGRVDIAFALESPAPQHLLLDLISNLTVDSVAWGGEAAPWTHTGDSLLVDVPPSAGDAEISVWYHGFPQPESQINAGMLFRSYGSTRENPDGLGRTVFTVSEPWSANSWWPCKDHLADKATATIAMTVPDTMRAVANGLLVEEAPADAGWTRFVWEEDYPLSTYLIGLAVANYTEWEEDCALSSGVLPLTFHVYPTDETAARNDLGRTCEMIAFMETLCGPYPFMSERYGHMEIKWPGAMEHQTSTSVGQVFLPGTGYYDQIIVHELAHQWFGNLQTPADWSDIWLNEGFASYFQALWIEHDQGREAFFERMDRFGPGNPGHEDLFADDGILTDPWPILPNTMIYHKGAWVLHMLRGAIGDAAFFDFLHAYDPARAYGHVTTADMVAAAQAAAGRDLSAFLDPWLYTSAVPHLVWRTVEAGLPGGGTRVKVVLEQEQETLFELHVPLRIRSDSAQIDPVMVLSTAIDSFSFDIAGAVQEIELDPDGWVLMSVRDTTTAYPPPAGGLPTDAITLMPLRPSPSDGRNLDLAFYMNVDGDVRLNVYDIRGRRRDSLDLGYRAEREDPYLWIWNAVDDGGRRLPAGCYWLEIKVQDRRDVQKVTIIR